MADLSLAAAMKAAAAATEPTEVKFQGVVYRVRPPMQWRQSAMTAIRSGEFNQWAATTFVNDRERGDDGKWSGNDDAAAFIAADLTNAEVVEFFQEYADAAGQNPGE